MSDPERVPLRSETPHHEILILVASLHQSNRAQWDAEDAARGARSDAELAAAKRAIDSCNASRVGLIEGINAAFARLVSPSGDVPPLTSQPGASCDQLSVLNLRLKVAMRESGSEDGAQRLSEVRRAAEGLIAAFDADLEDARAGRRSCSALPIHKIYRTE